MKAFLSLVLIVTIGVWASAAQWTVSQREAVTVCSDPWPNHAAQLAIAYKGEAGTVLAQHDDWIEVSVDGTNLSGWVWAPVVESRPGALTNAVGVTVAVGSQTAGAQGCGLFASPLNDVAGKRIEGKAIAFLKAGTKLTTKGFTRPSWYLVAFNIPVSKIRKEALNCVGWVYGPYGTVK